MMDKIIFYQSIVNQNKKNEFSHKDKLLDGKNIH